ncbi:hypothetical protein [Vitiosangium sp. GDMCC 1.1324]|uniref:hypothetical protein n=1 Tax=Vitiosangium sp. (strain GDMCC 1.1324) TaxID=2138576 RepID=UPI000D3CC4D3|nr:hypothetical protein [Vitiosangium sp. GDMCC 1.1324]PTL81793.1 hypothetical protein DAT35_22915 [Vitiosangium sp. GDMCC 1.1324]
MSAPEHIRRCELWDQKLKKLDQWWAFLDELEKELPGFTIGDGTATANTSFRCSAYPPSDNPRMPPWVVVGCVSILAPVYTIYGVQHEYSGKKHIGYKVFLDALPPEMRPPAEVIARKLEAIFEVRALPHEIAQTPIPLIVDWKEPPNTTLFHALFTSEPQSIA